MIECDRCHRHVRASEERCPFCDGPRLSTRVLNVLGGALTTLVLAACYGSPDGGPTKTQTGDTGDTGATTGGTTPSSQAMRAPIVLPGLPEEGPTGAPPETAGILP